MMKSIFITGGTSGIGLATAYKFRKEGYRVGVCGRNRDTLSRLSTEFEVFEVDVKNLEEITSAIKKFSNKGLDIVFANAGIGYDKKSTIPNFTKSREIIDINVNGVLNTFEFATEFFLKQGRGHLVATGSIAGLNGLPGVPAYSGSKAAIIKICESLSIDLKSHGISVTCINPGFIDTPLTRRNDHPMPFLVKVDKMADVIFDSIVKKKSLLYYPYLFSAFVILLSFLPRTVYRKIISTKALNYTRYTKD